MSVFLNRVQSYCDNHGVSTPAKIKLLGHYPLFKAHWHANYGAGFKKKVSQKVVSLFRNHRISHQAKSKNGQLLKIPISFAPEDLSSFQEVFWGGEYDLPWDITGARSLIDLGANTGMAALYFASHAQLEQLVLVEANPELVKTLRLNVPEAEVENICISGVSGEDVHFYISPGHRHSSMEPIEGGRKIAHKTLSLSELLEKHQIETLDILKMDIEGAEYQILEHDGPSFARCRFIVAEVHGVPGDREQFCSGLGSLGFELQRPKAPYPDCETLFARNKKLL